LKNLIRCGASPRGTINLALAAKAHAFLRSRDYVTPNDVKALAPGTGCHAAFCSPKGRLVSDAFIYALPQELLLDFEPGLTEALKQRLEHHIVAEDVQVVEVAPYYGLFTVQGPRAAEVVSKLGLFPELPAKPLAFASASDATLGELYLMNHARTVSAVAKFNPRPPARVLSKNINTGESGALNCTMRSSRSAALVEPSRRRKAPTPCWPAAPGCRRTGGGRARACSPRSPSRSRSGGSTCRPSG
jgi:hypothetical protein